MAKIASEAAILYAKELPVLEQARTELHDCLDDLWRALWEEVKPQLDEMQSYSGAQVREGKRMEPGGYRIGIPKKLPVKLRLAYRDLRQESTPGSVSIRIFASNDSRKYLAKTPELMNKLYALCEKRELAKPDTNNSMMLKETIKISLDDLGAAIESIKDKILEYFGLITEFEKWMIAEGMTDGNGE